MKTRTTWKILALLIVLSLTLAACGLLQEPEEASAPLEAIPVDIDSESEAGAPEETESDAGTKEAYSEEPIAADTDSGAADSGAGDNSGSLTVYAINPGGSSTVTFELDEELRGQPKTVVGETDQVAGELAVDLGDLSSAQLGVVQINARGFTTDNSFRNRAIQNRILETGAFEFITFTPTAIDGLPAGAAVGDEVAFTVSGDLTIRDITQPATFDVVATVASESQLVGSAKTTVLRADYELSIPSVRDVANVEEEVLITINFVADAK